MRENNIDRDILLSHNRVLVSICRELVQIYLANRGTEHEFVACVTPERGSHTHNLWKTLDILVQDKP